MNDEEQTPATNLDLDVEPSEAAPEASSETPDMSQEPETPVVKSPKVKKPLGKKKLLLILLAVLLAAGAGAYYWFVVRDDSKTAPAPVVEQKQEPTPEQIDEALKKFITPTTGETWLATPKKLALQGYLTYDESDVTYYQVGSRADNTINMSVSCQLGCDVKLYEVTAAGAVTYIARPDSQAVYNQDSEASDKANLTAKVAVDTTTHYDSLSMPASLEIEHGYKVSKPVYPNLGEPVTDTGSQNKPVISDVKTYGASKLVKSETSYADTSLTSIGYGLMTPLGTRVWLAYEPVPTSLSGYKWSAGNSADSDKLKAIARGCGGGLSATITRSDVLKDSDVQVVGKSSDGQDIYELKDTNNALLTKAYQEFTDYVATDPNAPYAGISKTDFVKEHGLVLAKDKFGQWLVYTREQLSPAYGCAKPVVYLYPTSEQAVNVRVGADVKVSDPLYPARTGWDVIARPNGQIMYNGQAYGSLFWEGPGIGEYPAVTSGTVVRQQDAIATIRTQLAQQGLNTTEINDFVAYWQDKLPAQPYVRLTWFNTAQLNQLAPLAITPKPDTVIRVFLDFAGLDSPINLPAQQFSAVPRNGFTVVEWGGLSPHKLY